MRLIRLGQCSLLLNDVLESSFPGRLTFDLCPPNLPANYGSVTQVLHVQKVGHKRAEAGQVEYCLRIFRTRTNQGRLQCYVSSCESE